MKIYFFKLNVFIKFNVFKATFPFPGDGLGKRNVPTGRSYIIQYNEDMVTILISNNDHMVT